MQLQVVFSRSKILLIPVFKWAIACRFQSREIPLFGLRYVIWIAFEAVLFDADQLFLQSLCGTSFISCWYWLMGASVGRNVCIMGSSVGCGPACKPSDLFLAFRFSSVYM